MTRKRAPLFRALLADVNARLDAGDTPHAIALEYARDADAVVRIDELVPGVVGTVGELVDGPIEYVAARVLIGFVVRARTRHRRTIR